MSIEAQILGSILVATVLKTEQIEVNTTYFSFEKTCGVNNCQSDKLLISTSDPTKASIYTLLGILLGINFLGILTTIFFMDDLSYEIKVYKRIKKKVLENFSVL